MNLSRVGGSLWATSPLHELFWLATCCRETKPLHNYTHDNILLLTQIAFVILAKLGFNLRICFSIFPVKKQVTLIKPQFDKSQLKKFKVEVSVTSSQANMQQSAIKHDDESKQLEGSKKNIKPRKSTSNKCMSIYKTPKVFCWLEFIDNQNSPSFQPYIYCQNLSLLDHSFEEFITFLNRNPLQYVLAADNNCNLFDLTLRYCKSWSACRKDHVDFEYYCNLVKSQCSGDWEEECMAQNRITEGN